MQDEILELYEKINDQLSQEEFLAEMAEVRESFGLDFVNDVDCAREVLKNHGIEIPLNISESETDSSENTEEVPFEVSFEGDEEDGETSIEEADEITFEMTDELLER